MVTFGLHIRKRPIQHRIIFVESKEKCRKPIKVINIKTGISKKCDSYASACVYIKCTRGSIRYALLHNSIINNTYKIELL